MNFFQNCYQGLLDLFLQSQCPLCQRPTSTDFCPYCQKQLQRCQITQPEKFWGKDFPLFPWGTYSGSLKKALWALKYEKQPKIAQPLGFWLGETWLKSRLKSGKNLLVVPIPLHPNKLRSRGFNQAELLAESFCQVTNLHLAKDALERRSETEALHSKLSTERRETLRGAFQIGKSFRQRHPKAEVLLLDDIYTTGATALEAADTLRKFDIKVCGIVAIATSEIRVTDARLNFPAIPSK
ncbi:ComF family protein [Aerosakkonemataceae cyanobacterium BLCC-F154]|uniref:ComF family protein n=1 Tax=Floridaenema fluviatile BLCC-F154 TaxID=3153640 RepID=A0ABV4YF42_9CYAN